MFTDGQWFDEVRSALGRMKAAGMAHFTDLDVAAEISPTGALIPLDGTAKIRAALVRLWGSGVQPDTIGAGSMEGGRWSFGPGRPPVSREIPQR